jgi:hypothetical protein|tara:strand:- start:35 stop:328 length:294 start_codon:yes stop_codon:yes gene_type:complete
MVDVTKELIDRLEKINTETHLPLERRLIDTAVWYHKNKDRIPRSNIEKRLEFLEKSFDIMIELMAMSVERHQNVEGHSNNLWLPQGMSMMGDIKEFG